MTMRLRVVVVEDEPLARSGAVALLSADPEIDVVGDYGDGHEAIREIRRLEPDIVFLDIQLRGMTGFDVLTALSDGLLPVIVFVTAFDQFAVRAFDVNAVDYLVKPYDDDRFARAVERAKRQAAEVERGGDTVRMKLMTLLETVAGAAGMATDAPVTRLIVRGASRVVFVRTEDVDWIEGASYYAKLHVNGRAHMMRETLSALERRLDPRVFFRVHRSAIVNLTRVQAVEPLHKGEGIVVLRDGTRLKLSRGRRPELDARIEYVEERR